MTLDLTKLKEAAEITLEVQGDTSHANHTGVSAQITATGKRYTITGPLAQAINARMADVSAPNPKAAIAPPCNRITAAADRLTAVWPELRVIFSRRDLETIAEVVLEFPEPERR